MVRRQARVAACCCAVFDDITGHIRMMQTCCCLQLTSTDVEVLHCMRVLLLGHCCGSICGSLCICEATCIDRMLKNGENHQAATEQPHFCTTPHWAMLILCSTDESWCRFCCSLAVIHCNTKAVSGNGHVLFSHNPADDSFRAFPALQ